MFICAECRREMKCVFNGMAADYGNGVVYNSDVWQCPECNRQMLNANNYITHDPDYNLCKYYLTMRTKDSAPGPIHKVLEKFKKLQN